MQGPSCSMLLLGVAKVSPRQSQPKMGNNFSFFLFSPLFEQGSDLTGKSDFFPGDLKKLSSVVCPF